MLLCLLVLQNTLSRRGQVASLSTEYLGASGRSFLSTWEPTFPWRSLSLSISDLTVALKVILTLMVHLNEQNSISLDIGIKYSREALMFVPYNPTYNTGFLFGCAELAVSELVGMLSYGGVLVRLY